MSRPSRPQARSRARVALAVVLGLGLSLGALALITHRPDRAVAPPPPLSTGELRAEDLEGSVAVVVHFNYGDTAYARQAQVLARLRELGVGHVRDTTPAPGQALVGLQGASALGIKATLLAGQLNLPPAVIVARSLQALAPGAIDAFEGPNEYDGSGDPAWAAMLGRFMPALADATRRQAPGVAVIGPSLLNLGNRAQLPPDLPGVVNLHPYPGGEPPEPAIAIALDPLTPAQRRHGVVFSEDGYHNALHATTGQPPVSEAAAAVYLPRLLVAAFGAGVRRTFLYELADEKPDPALADPEQHFGLLRQDLSPKPGFTAVATLLRALRSSPGAADPGRLRWTLEGAGPREVQRLTLVRADGSHVIALWRPVSVWDRDARRPLAVDPLPVTVALAGPPGDVEVWRPSVAQAPVLRRAGVRRVPLSLGGDLVLVSVR